MKPEQNEKDIIIEALENTKKALQNDEINSICYRLETIIRLNGLTIDIYEKIRDMLWEHRVKPDKRASKTTFWWPINVCRDERIKTIDKTIKQLINYK